MGFTGGVHNATTGSTVELFVTDSNNKLIQVEKTPSGSWTYTDISTGYQLKGKPAVLWGTTGVDVFTIAKDGALVQHHTNFGQGTWDVYTVLPASKNFDGGVDAVLSGSTVELFLANTAHHLVQAEKTPTSPWVTYDIRTDYEVDYAPTIIWGTSGVDVYANGKDGALK
ncbi:hypothetical protein IPP75_04425 [Candidatus Saccharibacteria bacterium]|nr:MAG: hypothetical protein IPP75_04425 [Candidatus Saccharibacteria bacterium]